MLYLVGWKSVARHAGVHVRTIKRWHYERARIPFIEKFRPNDPVKITIPAFNAYMKAMPKPTFDHLFRSAR